MSPPPGNTEGLAAACIFCSILAGETPAHVVLEDDLVLAFLDVRPLFPGHVLVVPRRHVEALPDLPVEQLGPYFQRVQRVAAVLPEAMGSTGTFVAINNVVSQSVPHLHTHVVPRTKGDGLKGFFWPRSRYDHDAHAARVASDIADALRRA